MAQLQLYWDRHELLQGLIRGTLPWDSGRLGPGPGLATYKLYDHVSG